MEYRLKWIGGATWVLDVGNIRIACDPVLCAKGTVQDYRFFKSERLEDPVYTRDDFKGLNFWLISHIHEDHIDMRGMAVIGDTPLYSPVPIERKKGTKVLKWGETHITELPHRGIIRVTAIPAIHASNTILGGMVGNGNGYLVEYRNGEELFNLYVSGDTLINNGMIRGLKGKAIDLAILNAGNAVLGDGLLSRIAGRITMNKKDIARFDRRFHPGTIVPVHWGTFSHYRERLDRENGIFPSSVKLIRPGETLDSI
jgi:L-ascorbate metabolism protein UlaG (beta-lactamase superfamily)